MIEVLSHIVQNSAIQFPDREAYRCGNEALTFQQLHRITDQLANYLVGQGVEKGDRVGIYLPRSIESVIGVYGIMKAGAAFVPLDPLAPASRIEFLIEDCDISFLVTAPSQTRRLKKVCASGLSLTAIIGIDTQLAEHSINWEELNGFNTISKLPDIEPNDLAYVMYTSGSTGAPKGIMHTHASGLNYARLSAKLYSVSSDDRVAGHAPLHFDISTFSYFTAPLAGACTVIIPEAYTKVPASLSSLIENEKITIWYSVPLALIQLLTNGLLEQKDLGTLRWVLFGGEVFAPKYIRELMHLWPQATFCNVYGPAEINQCTNYSIEAPPTTNEPIPLGKIWFDDTFKILNNLDAEVAKGEVGELVVSTKSMMKGYWNNPELTERSLFKEVSSSGQHQVYYRTGDMVYENKQGNLVFQGRNDRQIKVRGYRVELDEVEAVLSSHLMVEEAATFTWEDESKFLQIGAAVIPTEGVTLDEVELVSFCKSQLPKYAIPGRIEIMSEFPRTSSGKIRRNELSKIIS